MNEFYEQEVEEVMQGHVWDLPLVGEKDDIRMVLIVLTARGYVWVVDDMANMNIVGVITEHDALYLFEKFNEDMTAGDIAKRDLIYCTKEEKIKDVLDKVKRHNVRRLSVVENGKIIGEITLRHLIEKFYSLIL